MTRTPGRKQTRIIAAIAAPVIVIGLIAGLFFSFAAKGQPPARNPTDAARTPDPTEANGVPAAEVDPVSVSPEDIVAQVNRWVIPADLLILAQRSDRAMAALFGGAPASEGQLLEMLVNGELVWQQAETAGFDLDEEQVAESLESLLASQGKSMADLEAALGEQGLSYEAFHAYFERLVTIERFSAQQTQALGVSADAYVQGLQSDARISFGPAASISQDEASLGHADPLETEPIPTPTPTYPPDNRGRGTNPGQLAPNFSLPPLDTSQSDFLTLADFEGRPVLLSFWTTWCPYCQAQTPVLVEAYDRYGEEIYFVGITVREDRETVQSYLNANPIPYPILIDSGGQAADLYTITGFPTTYFLDASGQVVDRQIGQLKPERVDAILGAILATEAP